MAKGSKKGGKGKPMGGKPNAMQPKGGKKGY